jgi:BolA protein
MTKVLTKADRIEAALRAALAPSVLDVMNESHKHAGHAGDDGTGETHYHVRIASAAFEGKSRIARHRAIHAAIGPDLMAEIHALSLDIVA